MAYYTRNLTSAATYFPPAGQDGFGALLFGAAQPVLVRWQMKSDLIRDSSGNQVLSTTQAYVSQLVQVGGRIGLGVLADPESATEIRQVGVSPSLRPGLELVKAWL